MRTSVSLVFTLICFEIVAAVGHAKPLLNGDPVGAVDEPSTPNTSAASDLDSLLRSRCPGAVLQIAIKGGSIAVSSETTDPINLALRQHLLEMARQDQEARQALAADGNVVNDDNPKLKRVEAVDAMNLKELKRFVNRYGFPTAHLVGTDGVHAAWLLTQHADTDPTFQARLLPAIHKLVQRGEIAASDYALLTDRVLVAKGKPQEYGSQFDMSTYTPFPIANEKTVDVRRAAVGLGPLKDYACFLKAMYSPGDKGTDTEN